MSKGKLIVTIVGLISGVASIATAIDYFFLRSSLSHALKFPDNVPVGVLIIVLALLLPALAIAFYFLGRCADTTRAKDEQINNLNRQLRIMTEQLDLERSVVNKLTSEVAVLTQRYNLFADLPIRIRGILKTGSMSKHDLIRALGLSTSDTDHIQMVVRTIGEMDDVVANSIGFYVLKVQEVLKTSNPV